MTLAKIFYGLENERPRLRTIFYFWYITSKRQIIKVNYYRNDTTHKRSARDATAHIVLLHGGDDYPSLPIMKNGIAQSIYAHPLAPKMILVEDRIGYPNRILGQRIIMFVAVQN